MLELLLPNPTVLIDVRLPLSTFHFAMYTLVVVVVIDTREMHRFEAHLYTAQMIASKEATLTRRKMSAMVRE